MSLRHIMMWFLGGVVLLVAGSIVLGSQQLKTAQPKPETPTDASNLDGDILSEDVTLTVTNGPSKQWELKAKQAAYNRTQTEAELATVTGTFFNDEEKPVATFSAPKGHYSDKDKAVTLLEKVAIISTDKDNPATLNSPHVTWSSKTDRISAKNGVELILADTLKSRGQTAEFTLDFSHVRLSGSTVTEMGEIGQ